MAYAQPEGMELTFFAEPRLESAAAETRPVISLDAECQAWDWVRAAGVSALELREAVARLLDPQD